MSKVQCRLGALFNSLLLFAALCVIFLSTDAPFLPSLPTLSHFLCPLLWPFFFPFISNTQKHHGVEKRVAMWIKHLSLSPASTSSETLYKALLAANFLILNVEVSMKQPGPERHLITFAFLLLSGYSCILSLTVLQFSCHPCSSLLLFHNSFVELSRHLTSISI